MYIYTSFRYGAMRTSEHESIVDAIETAKNDFEMEFSFFDSISRDDVVIIDHNQFFIELEHFDDD